MKNEKRAGLIARIASTECGVVGNVCAYYGCSSNVLHTPHLPIVCSVQANTFLFFLRLYIFSPRKLLCPTKSAHNAHRKQTKRTNKKTTNIKRRKYNYHGKAVARRACTTTASIQAHNYEHQLRACTTTSTTRRQNKKEIFKTIL